MMNETPPVSQSPQHKAVTKSLLQQQWFPRASAVLALLLVGAVAGCSGAGGSANVSGGGLSKVSTARNGYNISSALPAATPAPVPANSAGCEPGPAHGAACGAKRNASFAPGALPVGGLSAPQLRTAYGLPPAASAGLPGGPLIAIVVAFDNESAESDLAVYRSQYGLPPCTRGNGCFQVFRIEPARGHDPPQPAEKGQSPDATSWGDERALDLAMASAACPTCRLLLVEAAGQDLDSLADAVNVAASYSPAVISNSWGVPELNNATNIDPGARAAFNHPGIAITASTGDLGIGAVQFPASSTYVTAVGGTTLTASANPRGWSESQWAGSGDGCSSIYSSPTWAAPSSACPNARAVPDVSMLADTNPGVAVYNSGDFGWVVLGGTSVGAPFVAGLYAAASDYGASTIGAPSVYANLAKLNTVAGTNGSPNGLAGF
ncbi:MAG: hypothetical protein NVS3B28_22770 [Candidatus Velthaea sp.]